MKKRLTNFEKEIIEAILKHERDRELADLLFEQYKHLLVKKREFTGVGFYTYFYIPEEGCILNKNLNLKLGDIEAEIKGLKHGAGFILYINEGRITTLEGYCYDEKWPNHAKIINIF